jgi:TonB family protein
MTWRPVSTAALFALALSLAGVGAGPVVPRTQAWAQAPDEVADTGPVLPPLAARVRVSGAVEVEVLIDERGRVRGTNVLRSQPLLDDAACAAVRRMKFEPARVGDETVPSTQRVTISFPPPPPSELADQQAQLLCEAVQLAIELDPRPDSTGTFVAKWSARAARTLELLVSLQHPDGVEVDTAGSWYSSQFAADANAVWPTWRVTGKPLKNGDATGSIVFRLPEKSWWAEGRIAIVGLFSDPFSGRSIARQFVWRVQRDAAGPILVRDPVAAACVAGPYVPP